MMELEIKEVIGQEVIPTTFVLGERPILSKCFPVLMYCIFFDAKAGYEGGK